MISKSTHNFSLSDFDIDSQKIIRDQIKKHLEKRGIVFSDEWHYSTIANVEITLDLLLEDWLKY